MLFDKNELHTIDPLMLEFVEEYIFVLFFSCYSFGMLIAQFLLILLKSDDLFFRSEYLFL